LTTVAAVAGSALMMGGLNCSSNYSIPYGVAVTLCDFGRCTQSSTYVRLTIAEYTYCGYDFRCDSGEPVALCNGTAWTACTCGIPSGFSMYTGTVTFTASSGSAASCTFGGGATSGRSSSAGVTSGGSTDGDGSNGG
jgi:hypothetical protein